MSTSWSGIHRLPVSILQWTWKCNLNIIKCLYNQHGWCNLNLIKYKFSDADKSHLVSASKSNKLSCIFIIYKNLWNSHCFKSVIVSPSWKIYVATITDSQIVNTIMRLNSCQFCCQTCQLKTLFFSIHCLNMHLNYYICINTSCLTWWQYSSMMAVMALTSQCIFDSPWTRLVR